ncbi:MULTISPECIES: tail fiber domain-containing protein [unclassified Microcoleus]|uniref:tail fiber domain-containing protein n=1 Tax=unclassified Microcoleus TaxID=2642155 RepID=UPI002FD4F108
MADYNIPDRIQKRVRYFDGQFLKDQDFVDEQKYHINRQRLQNRLHVFGIIEGLDIQYQEGKVIVNPGTAIDQKGRLIVLANSKEINLENSSDFGSLVIFYQEKESDIATTREENNEKEKQGSAGNTRWYEDPEVTVVRKPTEEQVRLGNIKFDNNGNVVVSSSNRQYSGVFLPAGDSKGVTLRAGGEQNPNLAILDGGLSISGTLTVTEHTELDKTLTVKGNTTIEQELTVKSILLGENRTGVALRSNGAENPNLAILTGSLSISGTLEVKGKTTMTGDITTPGSLTARKITDGKVTITKGTIQKGASEIDLSTEQNPDLGLYSQEEGHWLRFVSNKGGFLFSSAGKYGNGSDPLVKIDPQGNLTAKGGLTVTGNTQLKDLNVSGNLNITGTNNLTGNINTNGSLTAGIITAERVFVKSGFIQKEGDTPVDSAKGSDMGIYSRRLGFAMRFVTNGGDFYFYKDGDYGIKDDDKLLTISRAGDLKVKREISCEGDLKVNGKISCGGKILIRSYKNKYLSHREDDNARFQQKEKDVQQTWEEMTLEMSSSRERKENISSLTAGEAITTLAQLNAVKYDYKSEQAFRQTIGFIAEEMPENLASEDRKTISPFEVIPILTKVLQEHQKTLDQIQIQMKENK